MFRKKRTVWSVGVLLVTAFVAHAAESLRIVPLVRGDEVLVSFELVDAYTNEVQEAVSSGLRTTFAYDVDLRMDARFWADRTVATAVVSITDEYDSLTQRHSLARRVNGRVLDALVTQDEAVVREWFTRLDRLPLCDTSLLEPNRDYYVRVSARTRPNVESLLAWTRAVTGQVRFTFVP